MIHKFSFNKNFSSLFNDNNGAIVAGDMCIYCNIECFELFNSISDDNTIKQQLRDLYNRIYGGNKIDLELRREQEILYTKLQPCLTDDEWAIKNILI